MSSALPLPSVSTGRRESWRAEWFSNPRTEIVAGLVVALALIPEAIAFSLIAGADPAVGLYASFSIAILSFLAQLPYVLGHSVAVWALVAAGLVIMYVLPRVTTAVPGPLMAIVVLTAVSSCSSSAWATSSR